MLPVKAGHMRAPEATLGTAALGEDTLGIAGI